MSTLEVGPGHVVVSNAAKVVATDTGDLWRQDEPHTVSSERRARIQRLIESRQRPARGGVSLEAFQLASVASAQATRAQLGLRSDLPVVLICPNVPFDAAYYVPGNSAFSAMSEWLACTVGHLAERRDCQVIIRSHPAERYYQTSETTASLLREMAPNLPPHIQIVLSDAPISTYSIMTIADLGVVYWSTTGLEMALRGLPVICGIREVHYNRKGFTLEPATREEYFACLDDAVNAPGKYRLTSRQIELAWCYADVFFHRWARPFPWRAGPALWRDLRSYPVRRMCSPEGDRMYGAVFRTLLGEPADADCAS